MAEEVAGPRLAGLVDLPGNKCAVVEVSSPPRVKHSLILREGQREGDFEVQQINTEMGLVRLAVGPNREAVELRLKRKISGSGVMFVEAELDDVLKFYAEFAGKNLLRWPQLPGARLSLQSVASSPSEAAAALESALAWGGIAVVPDGEKFLMIVPKAKVGVVKPRSATLNADDGRSAASSGSKGTKGTESVRDELLPQGVILFQSVVISEVAKIYAELLGRKLDLAEVPRFQAGVITFRNQTELTKKELIYALDTLFAWNGVRLSPVGEDKVRLELILNTGPDK